MIGSIPRKFSSRRRGQSAGRHGSARNVRRKTRRSLDERFDMSSRTWRDATIKPSGACGSTLFFLAYACEVINKIEQRVHEEIAARFQRVDDGWICGLVLHMRKKSPRPGALARRLISALIRAPVEFRPCPGATPMCDYGPHRLSHRRALPWQRRKSRIRSGLADFRVRGQLPLIR